MLFSNLGMGAPIKKLEPERQEEFKRKVVQKYDEMFESFDCHPCAYEVTMIVAKKP